MLTGVTFPIKNTKLNDIYPPKKVSVFDFILNSKWVIENKGKILKATDTEGTVVPDLGNGFVGAAFRAYNQHYNLVINPDDVWIAITTALASEINRHAEQMRHLFVNHEGNKELVIYGNGSILTANYDYLINQISDEINKNTKDDIRCWLECNFSTTTPKIKTISKVVLMGAMKNYFSYKMYLLCGLPKVTLTGSIEDWREIRRRVERLANWNAPNLSKWSEVLAYVLDKFVDVFQGKVDTDFWNGIAHETGGGSGPRYLQGWILSFIPFNDSGKYILNDLETIMNTGKFGIVDTNDIPTSAVEVPVTINDNGKEYKTIFYAGAIMSKKLDHDTIGTSLDWALIDFTR